MVQTEVNFSKKGERERERENCQEKAEHWDLSLKLDFLVKCLLPTSELHIRTVTFGFTLSKDLDDAKLHAVLLFAALLLRYLTH